MNKAVYNQIETKVLNVTIHSNPVLKNIDIQIPAKQLTAIIGPSGCGKTTLLKSFNRLLEIQDDVKIHGEIVVDGINIMSSGLNVPDIRKKMGLISQKPYPLPMSIFENIAYGLQLRGTPRQEIKTAVQRYIDLMGLKGFEKCYPHQLSDDMQQRAGLARALAINPSLLLMDEPFGALDAQTREMMQEELLHILEKDKTTMIFVTHSIDEAILLGDRIVMMSRRPGRIREILPVEIPRPRQILSVRAHPRYLELRNFIWEMLKQELDQPGNAVSRS